MIIVEEDSYRWNPNFIKYKDPQTGNYIGNVVGDVPLEIRLASITQIGQEYIESIGEIGQNAISEILSQSNKYIQIKNLVRSVDKEIFKAFGGGFVLGTSTLDSEQLF